MKIDTQTLARLAAPLAALATVAAPTVTLAADDTIEEIVVTARKRTENLQDVPDSITAFSASMIEERRIDRIADAIEVTPGVHMISDQDAGTNIITVRGIGTNRNLPASIAFVVDGVVLPDSDAFTADLSDVERIEILKVRRADSTAAMRSAASSTSRRASRRASSRATSRSVTAAARPRTCLAPSAGRSAATACSVA